MPQNINPNYRTEGATMKHTMRLKEDGEIVAILSDDEDNALTIHHKAGLTIALDHEEMLALASVLATLPELAASMVDENNFDEYDDARQLAAAYGESDRMRKQAIVAQLANIGYQLQWSPGKTTPDVVPIS